VNQCDVRPLLAVPLSFCPLHTNCFAGRGRLVRTGCTSTL